VVEVDVRGGMVDEHSATMILGSNGLFPEGMREATRFGTDVLVGRDAITRSKIILTDSHELFRSVDGLGRSGTTAVLTSEKTSSAFGRCGRARSFVLGRNNGGGHEGHRQ
jgi:hypothetical protein